MTTKRRRKNVGKKRSPLATLLSVVVVIAFVYVARTLTSASPDGNPTTTGYRYEQLSALDIVSTNPDLPEHVIHYEGMNVSFNQELHIPNWVAWELTREEATSNVASRGSSSFTEDPDVAGCATLSDYRGSGYDRGHMAPAADMKWSQTAISESFYLTNICPQAGSLNSGSWNKLEERCRLWAQLDSAIIIVCGPVLSDHIDTTIGSSKVAVPKRFFKVIASPWAIPPQGIGFIMPNSKVPGGMQACAVSIDSVESLTGHDFFSALPDSIENIIESQCRINYWMTRK